MAVGAALQTANARLVTIAAVVGRRTRLALWAPLSGQTTLAKIDKEQQTSLREDQRSWLKNRDAGAKLYKEVGGKSTPGGLGANKRTAKYVGGGAAVGAVLGAIFGGGKGAAIGGLLGGAGGAGAQVYTGRKKQIPAETELKYKLAEDLQLRPVKAKSAGSH